MSDAEDLAALRVSADYQFGSGAGAALFPPADTLTLRRSSGGRPRQILAGDVTETSGSSKGDRLVTYGTDGRFRLGIHGGKRLHEALDTPAYRVTVGDESEPFVRDGSNVFAKFVGAVDDVVRPGDEVLVVHEDGRLLAVGRAELSAEEMLDFNTGMAVKVREPAGDAEEDAAGDAEEDAAGDAEEDAAGDTPVEAADR